VPTLRLQYAETQNGGHGGDVLSCAYTPDGQFCLSAGWEGHLRVWEVATGSAVASIKVGSKPLTSCAVSPEGKRWLTGSLDGLLGQWDAMTQAQLSLFLAHSRPISSITYINDGSLLATASWDAQLILWKPGREREGRHLAGHRDIVAGCRFTPDGKTLASWGYDGTVRLWEVARARSVAEFPAHADRVTAGAICPDGRWLATGSRDGTLKLWELPSGQEFGSASLPAEIRACFFLLDTVTLVTVDAHGRIVLHSVPDLEPRAELVTRLAVQSAEVSPAGDQVALGCADGQVRFVAVDGFDSLPLLATLTQTHRESRRNVFQRLFGKSALVPAYHCTCPACRQSFELPLHSPSQAAPCPHCRRNLRMSPFIRAAGVDPALRSV
jgi:WD40 repeat protein